MDSGSLVEFDSPFTLLLKQGAFFAMCQKTGAKMYEQLFQQAKMSYENKIKKLC